MSNLENGTRINNPRLDNSKAAFDAAEMLARASAKNHPESFGKALNDAALNFVKKGPDVHEE